MLDRRKRLGDFGEQAVASFLIRQGYRVVARKWRCIVGEIDLVAYDDTMLVFVEVRTRRGDTAGAPEESVTRSKQERLIASAYMYIQTHKLPEHIPWRIDVVAVVIGRDGCIARLAHLRHAIIDER